MIALIAVDVFIFVFAFVCIAELSSRWLPTSTPVVRQFPFSFQLIRTACLVEASWFGLQELCQTLSHA
jgi:heme/copper-type cytochrome/quinol oxidase subunit 3